MSRKPGREQQATIAALLDAAGRRKPEVPLRRDFVQQGEQRKPVPGPLAEMVRRHDERGLDLYLLLRAAASGAPWDVARDARIWGRALGLSADADGGASAVSKTWARLDETYGLVGRERSGRLAKITVLHESGTRAKYIYPEPGEYFKIPFDYWTADDAYYFSLPFPAKAVLLIAASLKPGFALPADKASRWYGLSSDSLERGLRELRAAGLLKSRTATVESWLSPTGKTTRYDYWLQPPFAQSWSRRRGKRTPGYLRVVGE
jgi:hypothetical protein